MMRAFVLVALVLSLVGCRKDERAAPPAPSASASAKEIPATAAPPTGNAERGKALVDQFQCRRCHELEAMPMRPIEEQCVGCHLSIHDGSYKASKDTLARWQKTIVHLREVPALVNVGARLAPAWIEHFLLNPVDVRPGLESSMPRLALSPEQARDIAAYLVEGEDLRGGEPKEKLAPVDLTGASVARGQALFQDKGCHQCHAFTGAPGVPQDMPASLKDVKESSPLALAPDLRLTRERMTPAMMIRWLADPKAILPSTPMPKLDLSDAERRDLAAFVFRAELSPPPPKAVPARLPVLTRPVSYEEVSKRVFRNTCWHCHAEPDYAIGDGGPGNTGGFGFKPRGLNLAEYEGVLAGFLDDKGERRSVFSPMPDGTPRLVAALIARQREEAGQADPAIRGMPLGLPAVSAEDVQLVESWIAQGRPQ
jgi:mono/diheme cytochrome c family protein